MKTIREWFELMPLDIKEKALSYTDENDLKRLKEDFQSALSTSFIFKQTEEGHNYWWNISLKY